LRVFVAGRRIVVALGLAGVLLTAACGSSGEQPRTLPPVSTSPTPTATSLPAYDEKEALQAATAVVREYFRILNAKTSRATANQLGQLMTPTCECRKVAASTREVAEAGNHYFGRTHVVQLKPALDTATSAEVLAEYNFTRSGIANGSGSVLSASAGRTHAVMNIRLQLENSRWLIAELVYVRDGTRN
jgi:hypothetical protein